MREKQARRTQERGTLRDDAGEGIVVFDIETTHLIDESRVGIEEMEASIACATRLHDRKGAYTTQRRMNEAEHYTLWHKDAGPREHTQGTAGCRSCSGCSIGQSC